MTDSSEGLCRLSGYVALAARYMGTKLFAFNYPSFEEHKMLKGKESGFWTFEEVQARLVEAVHLWRRSPGEARWPFATDAPWHLMTRATRADAGRVKGMDLQRVLNEDDEQETKQWQGRERPRALTREEIARRDQASEWLALVEEADRRILVLALYDLAAGRRVSWMAMRGQVGVTLGAGGLARRYSQAITRITTRLNRSRVGAVA